MTCHLGYNSKRFVFHTPLYHSQHLVILYKLYGIVQIDNLSVYIVILSHFGLVVVLHYIHQQDHLLYIKHFFFFFFVHILIKFQK